jgi:hypothetical protein
VVLIILSDTHISAGALDDCDGELERCIVDFIASLTNQEDEIELVINGDFLDFVQAPPWDNEALRAMSPAGEHLCFTENQSVEKICNILDAHQAIFSSLRHFLSIKKNRLVILPGNHDADFFWADVRNLLYHRLLDVDDAQDKIIFLP